MHDQRCMRCMELLSADGSCPNCHFDAASYRAKPHQLPLASILNGKYLVGCVLGEGGFGITYVAWDLVLDMMVAVKEYYPVGFVSRDHSATNAVLPVGGDSEEFFSKGRERFLAEAKKLARFFANPGVVTVKDYFTENGTGYIVMEYIKGCNLGAYLERCGNRMELNALLELLVIPMRSLEEVHAVGIIHRDISPENLMVADNGYVKLIDFGASKILEDPQRSTELMLRPGYAPEEMYRTNGKLGPWTDVYELCATVYRAITGVTPPEAPERLRRDELIPPSKLGAVITPAQERALLKGLAVLAKDRYATMQELREALVIEKPIKTAQWTHRQAKPTPDLAAQAGDTPLQPKLSASAPQAGSPLSGKRKLLIAGAAALLCVIIALVLLLPKGSPPLAFADADFERLLHTALGRADGDAIRAADLAAVDTLSFTNGGLAFAWAEEPGADEAPCPVRNFYDLEFFPALTRLQIRGATDVELTALPTSLTQLELRDCGLMELDGLVGLTGLTTLNVSANLIRSLQPLEGMSALTELSIADTLVDDLRPLSKLAALTTLDARNTGVTDWSPVAGLSVMLGSPAPTVEPSAAPSVAPTAAPTTAPTEPSVSPMPTPTVDAQSDYFPRFQDIGFYNMLWTALGKESGEYISRDEMMRITQITISGGAMTLDYDENAEYDEQSESWGSLSLSDLQFFPNLRRLHVSDVELSGADTLQQLRSLRTLWLTNCGLTDCSAFAHMPMLTRLYLYDNPIGDISALEGMPLIELGLSDTDVSSLEPLRSMDTLCALSINHTGVTDLSPLSGLAKLETLYARYTSIKVWLPVKDVENVYR